MRINSFQELDYYLYSADLPGLYESLTVVSDACRKTGREMWMVLQVNSNQPEVFISEEQLRFQAGCALAFGAQTILWACYCAGWWHNHVLDRQGNYEKLKAVNAGLHRLGETYMQYRHTETHFVGGFSSEELSKTGKAAIARLDTTCIRGLHAGGTKLLIGQMQTHQAEMPGEFFFAWTVFIGSAYAYRKRQHLGVDILINRLPYRIR